MHLGTGRTPTAITRLSGPIFLKYHCYLCL